MGLMSKSLPQNSPNHELNCSECNKRINAKQPRVLFKNGRATPVCNECYKDPEKICFVCKKNIGNDSETNIVFIEVQGKEVKATICKECCRKEGIKPSLVVVNRLPSSSSKKPGAVTAIISILQIFWILFGFSFIAEGIAFLRKKKCNDNFTREDILKAWVNIIIGAIFFLLWCGGIFLVYFFIFKDL